MTTTAVSEGLAQLVGEDLKIVSFKWLARHHSISAAAAKQHLQAFAKQHSKSLTVTYLLSGFTQDEPPRHVVQLVNQGQLKERRAALDSETSFHVYSVQPAQIKDPAELWNSEHLQAAELLAAFLQKQEPNCLIRNTCSAIPCPAAAWAGIHRAVPPAPEPAPAPQKSKHVAAMKQKIGAVMARPSSKPNGQPADASKPPASSSQEARIQRPSAPKPASGVGGAAALKAAFSKAKPAAGKSTPAATKAAPAAKRSTPVKAAPAAAAQDSSDSEDEEDAGPVPARRAGEGNKAAQIQEDSSEEDVPAAPAAGKKRGKSQEVGSAKKRRTVLSDSDGQDSEDDFADQPAAAAAQPGQQPDQEGAEEEPTKAAGKAPSKRGRKPKAAAKAGSVKAGEASGQPGKRRVLKTSYNDKGEELTEMVWEDDPNWTTPSQPSSAAPAASESAPAAPAAPAAAAPAASKKQQPPASGKDAGKAASPPAKAPAAKGKAGKGKAAATTGSQRQIQSFFTKKG